MNYYNPTSNYYYPYNSNNINQYPYNFAQQQQPSIPMINGKIVDGEEIVKATEIQWVDTEYSQKLILVKFI